MPATPASRFRRRRPGNAPTRSTTARRPPPSRTFAARRTLPARAGAWLLRNRRLTVALLLCLAAGIAVHQLTPASEHKIQVLVAARDLPAGLAVGKTDLVARAVPPDVVPAGALSDWQDVQGRQLAAPLSSGQIPTDAQLLGPGLLTGAGAGAAAVPVRLADPSSIQLVSAGQLVNIVLTVSDGLGSTGGKPETLAAGVPVLWTSAQGGKTGDWLGTPDTDGLMVVAANPAQAGKLAGASTRGKLFFVLVPSAPRPAGQAGS
ncbi:RcpC/CpaB family pilus assembly protein [Arthrobacter celericrescens]|uniref:RcpC/CpaB family pilus assembly protein n=1 Tax=Arthrobacter celericrescens TaxID=2320851 RepID=UPI000EA0E650|nr:RcpC/CpaB family pilus assembly protein [Arthrobacter celericrescens]